MATHKFIGRSSLFGVVDSAGEKCNKRSDRTTLDDVMDALVERQRAAVCLREKGILDDQGMPCGCIFCSPETQREKFGATIEEMDAQFAEEAAWTAARGKTRYVRGMLAYERIRHDRRKAAAIRGQ